MRTLVWFRGKDLRVADHAPLSAAAESGEVVPLFVLEERYFGVGRPQRLPHRLQFLLDSLVSLAGNLERRGSRLLLFPGRSVDLVPELVARWGIDRVVAHRGVESGARARDRLIAEALAVPFDLYEGETLLPPGTLRSGSGRPYSVFRPFARALRREASIAEPLAPPKKLPRLAPELRTFGSVPIPTCENLGLTRNPRLLAGGEEAAHMRLERFLEGPAVRYDENRDRMDIEGTSRLSADLKFGTLSIRQVWVAAERALGDTDAGMAFLDELLWREFSYSTLWDRPEILHSPFKADFEGFPWRFDENAWRAWAEGRTGYPVVDAASRQLLGEGFVHNRARMISASFLTKHQLIPYRHGEAHYLQYLTDGDPAQNNAGWQWSAGCGCDAQPYFRVFNPVLQGRRFDPQGDYVRHWVPELARLPSTCIHSPWTAPQGVLEQAGVELGVTYPGPVVDHKKARADFLTLAKRHLGR